MNINLIEKIIFHNRAPFEHLELNFKDKDVIMLNAINGGGKTTILSHIVDFFMKRHVNAIMKNLKKSNKVITGFQQVLTIWINRNPLLYILDLV